jgi:hypothetical protein
MSTSKTELTNWEKVQRNSSYCLGALEDHEGKRIKWHSPSTKHSSQVVCVSAFGALRQTTVVQSVLGELFSSRIVDPKGPWKIELEKELPDLLNENGSTQPTSIDAFFTCSNTAICLEAKFKSDAKAGFSGCGQVKLKNGKRKCAGYHGPTSDLETRSQAWCRLEVWDGMRSPRLYWSLGKNYFRPDVFSMQSTNQTCPFKHHNYQLMRNFLFAAAYAQQRGLEDFGVVAITPSRFASILRDQIDTFCSQVLLPEHHERIQLTNYEEYVRLLHTSGCEKANELAAFLGNSCLSLLK